MVLVGTRDKIKNQEGITYFRGNKQNWNASCKVREEKGLHMGSRYAFTGALLQPVTIIRHVGCS